jgi:peptide deformylase
MGPATWALDASRTETAFSIAGRHEEDQDMDLKQLRIIHYPDSRLHKRCKPVETIDGAVTSLAERMFELMAEVRGLGLAAPQVGLNMRMFITNHTGRPEDRLVYVNPEIIEMRGQVEHDEGCLSVPEVYVPLKRAHWCKLRAFDLDGQGFELEAEELLARALQHEMDHLNGVLIVDRMSPTSKIANRRLLKKLEDAYNKGAKGSPVTGRVGV